MSHGKIKTNNRPAIPSQGAPSPSGKATVLLAIIGMSPAILTETTWGLANPKDDKAPVIPAEVIVITTKRGRSDLERDLFTSIPEWNGLTVWQALRRALLGSGWKSDPRLEFKPVRIITENNPSSGRAEELEDIRTLADNNAAAKVILDEVRTLTSNDDVNLVASLAGGRKTMGALLHAAVSLLGRKQDRLTHVLVNEPFDSPALRPKFYFPGQPGGGHVFKPSNGAERKVKAADAKVLLIDVPFPPLHYLFKDYIGRLPGGWDELVQTATGMAEDLAQPVVIEISDKGSQKWLVSLDGSPVELSGRDVPFFCFLLERAKAGLEPYSSHKDAQDDFAQFLKEWVPRHPAVNVQLWTFDHEDLRKRLSSLRTRLTSAGLGALIPKLLPHRGPLGFAPSKVKTS